MTTACVKLSRDGKSVTFGADRLIGGSVTKTLPEPKWQNPTENLWFTVAGFWRATPFMNEMAEHIENAIKNGKNIEPNLSRLVKDIFEDSGIEGEVENEARYYGCSGFILMRPFGVWEFTHDLCVEKVRKGEFVAHGSGCEVAHGAHHALLQTGATDEQHVLAALRAAAYHDKNTRGPFDLFNITEKGVKHSVGH